MTKNNQIEKKITCEGCGHKTLNWLTTAPAFRGVFAICLCPDCREVFPYKTLKTNVEIKEWCHRRKKSKVSE